MGDFYKTKLFSKWEELTPILKLFQKFAEEGIPPNFFYEASTTLISNPDKDITSSIPLYVYRGINVTTANTSIYKI